MREKASYIAVGQILKPQGIKGEFKVKPLTDDVARFHDLKSVFIRNKEQYLPYEISSLRMQSDTVYLSLNGINDRNQAELFRQAYLWVDRKDAVKLPEGRYFICDVMGCEVVDEQGVRYGTVVDIFQTGSNDLYAVKDEAGHELLLPALKSVIKQYNIDEGIITIDKMGLAEVEPVDL
jgi:16S rRNA processing protein RimM